MVRHFHERTRIVDRSYIRISVIRQAEKSFPHPRPRRPSINHFHRRTLPIVANPYAGVPQELTDAQGTAVMAARRLSILPIHRDKEEDAFYITVQIGST
jgi:hypothetical protein